MDEIELTAEQEAILEALLVRREMIAREATAAIARLEQATEALARMIAGGDGWAFERKGDGPVVLRRVQVEADDEPGA